MNEKQRARLAQVADLLRDRKLAELRSAAQQLAATQVLRDSLDRPAARDLPEVAAALAALSYDVWAERRRQELDRLLAAQTARLHRQQAEAARAFGRAEVLDRLGHRPRR